MAVSNLSISVQAAGQLISSHDGDMALLYLYRLLNPGASEDDAARDLCRTMAEINSASEKLGRLGAVPAPAPSVPAAMQSPAERDIAPVEELPQYTKAEISRVGNTDPGFRSVLDTARQLTGAFLSENFMRILLGLYDHLSLPAEVIMMLLTYCSELAAGRSGKQKLTARDVEREGYAWYNRQIFSLESAEEYISSQRSRNSAVGRIKAVLNIAGRNLTATEQKYVLSWLDMGFSEDAVAIAYDRTVTNTGGLKWSYMDKILSSWKEKKLITAEDINNGDSRKKQAPQRVNTSVSDLNEEDIATLINRI